MAQVKTTYQRSLEEYGRRRFRQGRDEGIRRGRDEGQASLLGRMVHEKFGPDAASQLSVVLGRGPTSKEMAVAVKAVLESPTTAEFLARLGKM